MLGMLEYVTSRHVTKNHMTFDELINFILLIIIVEET